MRFNDYTSFREALERYNRTPIPNETFNIEEIKEWTWEAMEKLNIVNQYVTLRDTFTIDGHRVEVPKGAVNIHRITDAGSNTEYELIEGDESYRFMTYKVINGFIYTDQQDGKIDIIYDSFPIDDNGDPMIPDNEYYISALEWFYRYKLAMRAYFMNRIVGQQLQIAKQEWEFYAAGAANKSKMMKGSRMKKFYRRTYKMIPKR